MDIRFTKKQQSIIVSLLIALFVTGLTTLVPENTSLVQEAVKGLSSNPDAYLVVDVIDGDTIAVEKDGKKEKVRLLGIDTPETRHPRKGQECFGKEASEKTKKSLLNKYVELQDDQSQSDRDVYDRLLRYVILEDGTNVNKQLVEEGYAFEFTYENNPYLFQEEFLNAQRNARENKRGLWAEGACP